tara:strand:- start:690 stop:1208 length:519 start_codon:yes stop_codon:yes gene_type:complete
MTEEQKKIADSWGIAARLSLAQALKDADNMSMEQLKIKWLKLTARYIDENHPEHLEGFKRFNADLSVFQKPSDIDILSFDLVSIGIDFDRGFVLLKLFKVNKKMNINEFEDILPWMQQMPESMIAAVRAVVVGGIPLVLVAEKHDVNIAELQRESRKAIEINIKNRAETVKR